MASEDANSNSQLDQSGQLPFVVAITGASGAIYGMRLVQFLMEVNQPVDLLMSKAALRVVKEEHDLVFGEDFKAGLLKHLELPDTVPLRTHSLTDYGASVASGSYRTRGMAVVPCSLGTLGAIASGLTENLIHRAAAVTLKERRTLLILVREMPFGLIQLRNMVTLSEAGAVVACASPGFYHRPQSVDDQIDFVVGRVLDQFGFDNRLFKRWKEDSRPIYQASKKLDPVGEGTYTFVVGLVTGVKGLRGDLKLKLKGNIDLIDNIKTVQVATADGARQIAHVRSFKAEQKLVLMSLKEFEDRTASEGIIGATLFTERSQLNELSEDEWWLDDLIGLRAFTVEGEELGKVSAVFGETSQLLEITNGEKSHLVPFVKALVPVVDIKAGRVEIVNLPGLFE